LGRPKAAWLADTRANTCLSAPSSLLAAPPRAAELLGVASLAEQLDRKLLVQTRDGRTVVGVLRSFDQFSNMVLEQAYERHIVHEKFADEQLGLFIVRGENLVLMGEIDDAREKPPELKEVSLEEIRDAMLAQRELEGLAGKSEREQKSILDDN